MINRNKIIYIAVGILVVAIASWLTYFIFFQTYPFVLSSLPPGQAFSVSINDSTQTVKGKSMYQLVPGKYKIMVKAENYKDYVTEIEVNRSSYNFLEIDMTKNKVTPTSLDQINGLSTSFVSNYQGDFQKLFENNQWMVQIIYNKKNVEDKYVLVAKREGDKWILVYGPANSDVKSKVVLPREVQDSVSTFLQNYVGEPENEAYHP